MKKLLNWKDPVVVNIFDEVTLWSAPFGRLLLKHIPMKAGSQVLDLGFGTGFPLIELSQRFGEQSTIYGMDIWEEGIARTRQKIEILGIQNIRLLTQSADQIPLEENQIDLICSNVGINNFDYKEKVYREAFRVLKKGGHLCLTTNPVGTFAELFAIFKNILEKNNWDSSKLQNHIAHRSTPSKIVEEISAAGFTFSRVIEDRAIMRFVDAAALLDHSLMRFAFVEPWRNLVPEDMGDLFFEELKTTLDQHIAAEGEFRMTIPMLYLEFGKG